MTETIEARDLQSAVERLSSHAKFLHDMWEADQPLSLDEVDELAADLRLLLSDNERMRKALEPFAAAYDWYSAAEGPRHDDCEIDEGGRIFMRDLRIAHSTLMGEG